MSEYPVVAAARCGAPLRRARAVLEWVSKSGAYVHRNITVVRTARRGKGRVGAEEGERGLVARGHISNFTRVIVVPPELQLSVATLRRDARLGAQFTRFTSTKLQILTQKVLLAAVHAAIPELRGGLAGLAFYLLHEAANSSSHIRAYLCSLPTTVPLPISFPPKELGVARLQVPAR